MKLTKNNVLIGYSILIFIFGILQVPLKWGSDYKFITEMEYAPIWKLEASIIYNNQQAYYSLDLARLIITLLVITLISIVLYVVAKN